MWEEQTHRHPAGSFLTSAILHAVAIVILLSVQFGPAVVRAAQWKVSMLAPAPAIKRGPAIRKVQPRVEKIAAARVFQPRPLERVVIPRVALEAPPVLELPRAVVPVFDAPHVTAAPAPLKTDNLTVAEVRTAPREANVPLKPAGFSATDASRMNADSRVRSAGSSTGAFGDVQNRSAAASRGVVRSSGFSESAAVAADVAKRPVARGAFGDTTVAAEAAGSRATARGPTSTPVEIQFKPRPQYTEEARRLQIEGEVELEIVFEASGKLRVVRVVRGLGHGLDENAVQAAAAIRFRPAQAGGTPVDSTAMVRIIFQLAD